MSQTELQPDEIKAAVRSHYANRVNQAEQGGQTSTCCSSAPADQASQSMGYSSQELASIPQGANLGAGCGNPVGLASLKPGHHVLDLGSGAGIDCFLAAQQVGSDGHVIGVDMLIEMVTRARSFTRKNNLDQVEFRLGEIECLPVETNTIDVILSNCVINLSPEKERVLKEAFRVLKPGGRIAFSDVVLTAEMPAEMRQNMELYSCCGSGGWPIDTWLEQLKALGFEHISVTPKEESRSLIRTWSPDTPLDDYIVSADISAAKPRRFSKRILVLCTHNSARSQMAEGWLRHLSEQAGLQTEIWSAGTEKTRVKPEAAQVMAEVGVDLATHWSKTIEELPDPQAFDAVLTVCDSANQTCPRFSGRTRRYHVSLPDPSGHSLERWRESRDQIRAVMQRLVAALIGERWPSQDELKETIQTEETMKTEQDQKTVLRVYDPAMCCSTGVCGPTVDPELARFAADLDWLKAQGVEVLRFNLAQQPGAFAETAPVKEALSERGESSLPLILLGSSIVSSGIYPTRKQLATMTGRESALDSAPGSSCCGSKSSCC